MDANHQFDFWLGAWRGTWAGESGPASAVNTVTKEHRGRVVVERFAAEAPETLTGLSVSVFDAREQLWKQTWVDDSGSYLDFCGGFDAGRMVLSRLLVVDGVSVTQRMVWHEIERDRFSWLWQRARGAGEWETLWAIDYRRIAASSAAISGV